MSEEQEKIQKYIIKSTPYGELNEVIRDLEKLSPLNVASPTISHAIEEYNEDHLALFPVKNSNQPNFPLMTCSRVAPNKYLDQFHKKIYTVDHLKGEIIAAEDTTVDLVDSVEELLNHLSESAAKYAAKYFRDPYGSNGMNSFMLSFYGSERRIIGCVRGNHQQKRAAWQFLYRRMGL